jgi:putative peptide zinc metalloprotease protein
LLIAASALFHGAGIVLAVFGVASWFVAPAVRAGWNALRAGPTRRPNWFRFATVVTVVTVTVVALAHVPWPAAVRAPAIVEYSSLTPIRTASDGFVREIHVSGGDFVEKGQILAVLQNDELELRLADLELRIEQSVIRSRQYQGNSEIATLQAESAIREAMETQRDELRAEVEKLTVRAPKAGNIIGRGIASFQDMYVEKGTKLLEIGDGDQKELRVSVAQDDVDRFAVCVSGKINVRLPGQGSFTSSLASVSPSANVEPPHPALCSPFGGPLTVCRKKASASPEGDVRHELMEPRFIATVPLGGREGKLARAGQIGVVSFRDGQESVGTHLYRIVSDWIRRRQGSPGNG